MKIKIDASPGELSNRLGDIFKAIYKIANKSKLDHENIPEIGQLPTLWGVVYAEPNPDNSRKNCSNCYLWKKEDSKCLIHGARTVTADHVCSYHFWGVPLEADSIQAQSPSHSGLEYAPDGTSCDNCKYYGGKSQCFAVANFPKVKPKGCCARWEGQDDVEKAIDEADLSHHPNKQIIQTKKDPDYKVLSSALLRAKKQKNRVLEVMQAKIDKVLEQR